MAHASSSRTSRWVAVAGVVALGALSGCGVGTAGAADAPASDASPASEVSPGDETAGVSTPDRAADGPQAAALAYVDFAAGGDGRSVPFADRVTYRVGGTDVATLTDREAARRGPWRACPPGETTYEGRECPVSALGSLAQLEREGAPVQVEEGWPSVVGCSRVDPASVDGGAVALSLRPPPQRRDCFSDVGVLLRVDGAGRIDLVELVLSGS